MSLTDYAGLQTEIAAWLAREGDTDLTTRVPTFIQLCEADMNARLRLRVMEVETPLVTTPGSRFAPLPAGFLEPLALWDTTYSPRRSLSIVEASIIDVSTYANLPQYWAIDGSNVAFECPLQSALPLTMRFLQSFALSSSATINWLLTNFPNVYLHGSLMQAAPYMVDLGSVPSWKAIYDDGMCTIQAQQGRSRSLAPLRTEVPVMSNARFNILRGY